MSGNLLPYVTLSNEAETINFFFQNLKDVVNERAMRTVLPDETLHVASVFAHYAQVSCTSDHHVPPVRDMNTVHRLLRDPLTLEDPSITELMGAQTLFHGGFWREHIAHRLLIDPHLYDAIGQRLYAYAGDFYPKSALKHQVFERIAFDFPWWAETCSALNQRLRQNSYILRVPPPPEPPLIITS